MQSILGKWSLTGVNLTVLRALTNKVKKKKEFKHGPRWVKGIGLPAAERPPFRPETGVTRAAGQTGVARAG